MNSTIEDFDDEIVQELKEALENLEEKNQNLVKIT